MEINNPNENPVRPDLIIYGGTFDPPHQGHIDCVSQVRNHFPEAKLLIMPALVPAGANASHKKPLATFQQRLQMCRLAFERDEWLGHVEVSPLESELTTPNFTVQTLEVCQAQHPDSRVALLLGQDQLKKLHAWHRPLELISKSDLIAIRRDSVNAGFSGHLSEDTKHLAEALELDLDWRDNLSRAEIRSTGRSIYLLQNQVSLAESVMIRDFIQRKKPLPDGWLPAQVQSYIASESLYTQQGCET